MLHCYTVPMCLIFYTVIVLPRHLFPNSVTKYRYVTYGALVTINRKHNIMIAKHEKENDNAAKKIH